MVLSFLGGEVITACPSGPSGKVLWQIGEVDSSYLELALAPDGYRDFVPAGFGSEERWYVVGRSVPGKDFPYVLPGPFDPFAGYGYWAGRALVRLPVYFLVRHLPDSGSCTLVTDLYEVSPDRPPRLRCVVNGRVFEQPLQPGRSSPRPELIGYHPQRVTFTFPVTLLKEGINEIVFQNMAGRWCVFDAVRLLGPEEVVTGTPGSVLVRSVTFRDREVVHNGRRMLPLLVDVLHNGRETLLRAEVDGMVRELTVGEGHEIPAFLFPAPEKEEEVQVCLRAGDTLLFAGSVRRAPAPPARYSDYVDPFMGTSGSRWMITPGPRMPMPMVQPGPNNQRWVWKSGYEYQVESISGINHTQEWTMAGFLMMPTTGPLQTRPGPEEHHELGYRSRIDKKSETARIGRYSVDLTDYNIHVDVTATTRAVMQRYVFGRKGPARVIIDAYPPAEYTYRNVETVIRRADDHTLEGYVHHICDKTGYVMEQDYKLFFVLEFSRPFRSLGGWTDKAGELAGKSHGLNYCTILEGVDEVHGSGNTGAFVTFDTEEDDTLLVRSSVSLASVANARLNLEKEITKPFGWDFAGVEEHQKKVWDDYLGRIEIETPDHLQKVKFYTNLYRALSGRVAWGDVNGQWVDMYEQVDTFAEPGMRLCSGEFWNTFWNVQQLWQLIAPEFSSMQVKSLLAFYEKGGWMAKGIFAGEYSSVMVAEHGIPWIVGAWNAGIRDFDMEEAYEMMYKVQTTPPLMHHPGGGRVGNESLVPYMKLGYVPLNTGIYQSYVSNTLEYAFDDWCLAQAARLLGKKEDHSYFMKRSENWRNIFDPVTGFMRPKNADGSWYKPFDPYHTPGFVEANAWQYSWFVPHNMEGLVEAVGRERFITRLDSAMQRSEKVHFNALGDNFALYPVNHGNQPNMQSAYLFNHAGAYWLTQKWCRAIQESYYGTGPRDAYPGDEDQGQMSAWYVMSTLGLFQMDGGASVTPRYELGSPRFERITIHLSPRYHGGKTFVIIARNASKKNCYIRSATLNGKPLRSWSFPAEEVLNGGTLILEMSDIPNQSLFLPENHRSKK